MRDLGHIERYPPFPAQNVSTNAPLDFLLRRILLMKSGNPFS